MTGFGMPGKWHKAMLVATGVGVLGASLAAPLVDAATHAPVKRQAAFHLQDNAQAEPSQVGEGDTESLDQGAPPAASGDDPENLDQGSPPAPAGAVPVPVTEGTVLTTASEATGTAYSEPAGPRLPPGFGEGRVLVSNNSRGFPVGLEPCEVGVVTGRAYVGVNCGEAGGPVVGHSTYEDFPWVIDPGFPFEPGAEVVTDPSFPFDEDSPFFESFLDRTNESDVVVLVSPRGFPFDDDEEDVASSDSPVVTTRGVVSLAQPARTGKERNSERTRSNGSASSGDVSSDPGKSRSRRSATQKQKASVSSDSKRGKNSNGKQGKSKVNKNKKKDNKRAGKESQKQRAKQEKREKRNKDK